MPRGLAAKAVGKLAEIWDSYPPIKAVWSLAGLRVFDIDPEPLAVGLDLMGYEQFTAAWFWPVGLAPMASRDQAGRAH
eukprot:12260644-Alexandrium_andersonii.AAC.1